MTDGYLPAGLDPEVAAQFTAARDAAHRTCYADADALLAVALARAPDQPLLLAYAALLAQVLYRDPASAVDRARELLRGTEELDDDLAEALIAFASRDLASSEERARAFISHVPDDPYARHLLGATLLARGSVADAVTVLESLIDDHPGFAAALNHLGSGYLSLGDTERGLTTLRRFVELDPTNASAHDSLADALVQVGDQEGAIAQLVRALLLDPSYAYAWVHLGGIFEELGETHLAARAYRTARDAPGVYGVAFADLANQHLARVALAADGDST
jgi:tetratricopeptide (TPR) repeat protein